MNKKKTDSKLSCELGDDKFIPLISMDISADIISRFMTFHYKFHFENISGNHIETVFNFPLPFKSKIYKLNVETDDFSVDYVVKENKIASEIYDKTLKDGNFASVLRKHRDDVFSALIGNIPPKSKCIVNLFAMQHISSVDNKFRIAIPTVLAPRYISANDVFNSNPSDIAPFASPVLKDSAPYKLFININIHSASDIISINSPSNKIEIIKSKNNVSVSLGGDNNIPDRDFILEYEKVADNLFHPIEAVKENKRYGFFEFIPSIPVASVSEPKEFVFIIDTSGSMQGSKIEQTKNMLSLCLRHLREGDLFNIYEFNSHFSSLFNTSREYNSENLQSADNWIDNIRARGGTDIADCLFTVLNNTKAAPVKEIILLTDGEIYGDDNILNSDIVKNSDCRIFTFGIDTALNYSFIFNLADITGGRAESILPNESIEDVVVRQFSRVISPVITNINIECNGSSIGEIYPRDLKTAFNLEPLYFIAELNSTGKDNLVFSYESSGKLFTHNVSFDMNFQNKYFDILDLLFKTDKIHFLEKCYKSNPDLYNELLDFSIKSNIISDITTFVAEKTLKNKPKGMPDKILIPLNLPDEWDVKEPKAYFCKKEMNFEDKISESHGDIHLYLRKYMKVQDDPAKKRKVFDSISPSLLIILKKQNPDGLITFNKKDSFINILGNRILYILIDINFSDEEKTTYKYLISKLFDATKSLIPGNNISQNKYSNLLFLISECEYVSDNSAAENALFNLLPDFYLDIPETEDFYDYIDEGNSFKDYRTNFTHDYKKIILFLASKFTEFSFAKKTVPLWRVKKGGI